MVQPPLLPSKVIDSWADSAVSSLAGKTLRGELGFYNRKNFTFSLTVWKYVFMMKMKWHWNVSLPSKTCRLTAYRSLMWRWTCGKNNAVNTYITSGLLLSYCGSIKKEVTAWFMFSVWSCWSAVLAFIVALIMMTSCMTTAIILLHCRKNWVQVFRQAKIISLQ